MLAIPTQPVPSQTLNVFLANQSCTINIYTNMFGMFCDLYVNDALIIAGVIAENANRIVRSVYLGFTGDLAFFDTQAPTGGEGADPEYAGLGDRFQLVYLEAADLLTRGLVT